MTGRMISPNEMLKAAKDHMLEGGEAQSWEDWMKVLNFIAFNMAEGLEEMGTLLFIKLYDIPVTEEDAVNVAVFQRNQKIEQ